MPCGDGRGDCVGWDLSNRWVDPGLVTKALVISGLPAFLFSLLVTRSHLINASGG